MTRWRSPAPKGLADLLPVVEVEQVESALGLFGRGDFALLRGADVLSSYRFGAGTTTNYFCSVCGIHTHFFSTYEERPHYAYSLTCCEGVDIPSLEVRHIDGESF
jgi:hypothetical protein